MKQLITALLALLACLPQANGQLAGFPDRPIRIIVPYSAGGPVDVLGRLVAKNISEQLKQPVIIDNRPGASGTVGANVVAKSQADGYTLLLAQSDTFVHAVGLFKKLPYDPIKDFQPVAQLAASYTVMLVRPEVPGDTLPEVLAIAKSSRKPLSYGSWGQGTFPHLVGSTIARQSGVDFIHVAYKGGAPSFQDFGGGQIQIAFAGPGFARNLAQSAKGKLVATAGPSRSPFLPGVPTFRELGFNDAIFQVAVWAGIAAPANTPPQVVKLLESALEAAMKSPEIVKYLADTNTLPAFAGSAAFKQALDSQIPMVLKVMRDAGVEAE